MRWSRATARPETLGYYVLHEGPIGCSATRACRRDLQADRGQERDSFDGTDAWLGFTDKYWAATLVPDTEATLQAKFSFDQDRPAARSTRPTICATPQTVAPGATGTTSTRLFAGAKEVAVVGINFPLSSDGGYNQALGLNHFDLLIDWGWFYFITKPMFLSID